MTNINWRSLNTYFYLLGFLFYIACAAYCIYDFWEPFSYHVDELFSIEASSHSFSGMFNDWLFLDVHPPLFQMILWVWIKIFGVFEPVARIPNLLYALASIVLIARFTFKEFNASIFLFTAALFCSSRATVYFAQDLRSYSLLLLLSTIAFIQFYLKVYKSDKRYWHYMVLLLLSLTHYFGTFTALLFIAFELYETRNQQKAKAEYLGLTALLFIWPAIHLLFGKMFDFARSGHWIATESWHDNFYRVLQGLFVQGDYAWRKVFNESVSSSYGLILLFVAIGIALYIQFKNERDHEKTIKIIQLYSFIIIFVLGILVIDLLTPISWHRNYIGILPMFSLVSAYALNSIIPNKFRMVLIPLALFVFINGMRYTKGFLLYKQYPGVNNRGLGKLFVEMSKQKDYNLYYYQPKTFVYTIAAEMNEHYPERFSKEKLKVDLTRYGKLNQVERPALIHAAFDTPAAIEEARKEFKHKAKFYQPHQYWDSSTVVIEILE